MIDTPQIADELAHGGVFTRGQAERPAWLSIKAAGEAVAAKADLNFLGVLHGTESPSGAIWPYCDAGLNRRLSAPKSASCCGREHHVMHATAAIGLTVGLIKPL